MLKAPAEPQTSIVKWDDWIPNVWKNKKCLKPPTRDLYIECIYNHVCIYIYNRHLSQSQVLRWCFFFTRPTTQGFWNKFYLWHVRIHASRMIIFSYWQCFLGLVVMFPLFSISPKRQAYLTSKMWSPHPLWTVGSSIIVIWATRKPIPSTPKKHVEWLIPSYSITDPFPKYIKQFNFAISQVLEHFTRSSLAKNTSFPVWDHLKSAQAARSRGPQPRLRPSTRRSGGNSENAPGPGQKCQKKGSSWGVLNSFEVKYLVGGWALPLWKMMEFVSWGYYSQYMGSHKIPWFQTTNQVLYGI